MSYCVLDDVKSRCQRLPMITTSTPTGAQVTEFIDQCSETIDGIVKTLGYVIPVTGTKSLKILKKLNADGAAFYAMSAAFSAVSPNASEQGKDYRLEWKNGLDALKKGEMILPDAPIAVNAQGQPRGSGFASSFETEEGNEPFIERDQEY